MAGYRDDFPPAPWRLRGEVAIAAVAVPVEDARRFPLPVGLELLSARGHTLGGVLLARYDERATLPYHELIVFSGVARLGGWVAFVVSHLYVDSEASLRGGREIWGLPKELADFTWASRAVTVGQEGRTLLRATVRRRGASVPLPLYAPVFGDRGGVTVCAAGRGHLHGAPALVRLQVPPTSPFADLRMTGSHLAVAGDELDLGFPDAQVVARSTSARVRTE